MGAQHHQIVSSRPLGARSTGRTHEASSGEAAIACLPPQPGRRMRGPTAGRAKKEGRDRHRLAVAAVGGPSRLWVGGGRSRHGVDARLLVAGTRKASHVARTTAARGSPFGTWTVSVPHEFAALASSRACCPLARPLCLGIPLAVPLSLTTPPPAPPSQTRTRSPSASPPSSTPLLPWRPGGCSPACPRCPPPPPAGGGGCPPAGRRRRPPLPAVRPPPLPPPLLLLLRLPAGVRRPRLRPPPPSCW